MRMKRLVSGFFAAVLAICFSGCAEIFSAFTEPSSGEIVNSLLGEGNFDEAEKKMREMCEGSNFGGYYEKYIGIIEKKGDLKPLYEGFPNEGEIMFFGKFLSEYSSGELLKMAGIDENRIGYRKDEAAVYGEKILFSGGANAEYSLPYGISENMSFSRMMGVFGFSEEQAELLKNMKFISVDIGGEKFSVSAKASQYAAFSQHPEEFNEFRVRKGAAELCFVNDLEKVLEFWVVVYV